MMRKYRCPQCDIPSMYVKNADGERLLVYVYENGEDRKSTRLNSSHRT